MWNKYSSGFTLIEVIIIIILIAIIVPAIIFPIYESSKQSSKDEEYLNALYLAEGKLEEISRFKSISGFDKAVNSALSGKFNDTLNNFSRNVTYSPYSSWRGIFTVTVNRPNIESIKIVTWFTKYSSL